MNQSKKEEIKKQVFKTFPHMKSKFHDKIVDSAIENAFEAKDKEMEELKKDSGHSDIPYKKFKELIMKEGIPANWGIWIAEAVDQEREKTAKQIFEDTEKYIDGQIKTFSECRQKSHYHDADINYLEYLKTVLKELKKKYLGD